MEKNKSNIEQIANKISMKISSLRVSMDSFKEQLEKTNLELGEDTFTNVQAALTSVLYNIESANQDLHEAEYSLTT